MLNQSQIKLLITGYQSELAQRNLSTVEREQRFNGFLACMCHFGEIEPYQMSDFYTKYQKELSTQKQPITDSVKELINRFKTYLAHDQYQSDKRTMMYGYLMALQHQRLIDPWNAHEIIKEYEQELANV